MKWDRRMARTIVRGSMSGLAATAVMSVVFVLGDRAGLLGEKPPRLIIDRVLPALSPEAADRVALLSHFGYGAVGGAAFAVLNRMSGPPVLRRRMLGGVGFGLLIWVASYEGWVPAAGVLPRAHRDHPGRAATILLAHVVYGSALGLSSSGRG